MYPPIFIFLLSQLQKKKALTPYIALGKTNPQEFPRNPANLSKIKGCKIFVAAPVFLYDNLKDILCSLCLSLLIYFALKLLVFTPEVR